MSSERRKYELEEQIARGGMGEVFRARKIGTDGFHRIVAIKRLHDSKALDVDARTMLRQEAEIGAMLDHPNIVPVWDFDEDSKQCVRLIMPYVDGVDLEDLLSTGMLPITVSVYVIMSILQGLAHAHARGIIHRDIKPGNILISRAGAVQIADFGLARDPDGVHLAAQTDAGTFGYMSPEALQSDWQDARSDLFAMGAMFYELLTGIRAFPGVHYLERVAQTLCQTPTPPIDVRPKVPQELSDITMRLLAPKPADRFPSAQAVIDALPHAQHGMEDLAALVKERSEQGLIAIPAVSTHLRPRTERAPARVPNTKAMRESVLARALAEMGHDPGDLAVPEPGAGDFIVFPGPRAAQARRRARWAVLALAVLATVVVLAVLRHETPSTGPREDVAQDSTPRELPVSQAAPSAPAEGEPAESEPAEHRPAERAPAKSKRGQGMDVTPAEEEATAPGPAPGPARRPRPAPNSARQREAATARPVAAPPHQHGEPAGSETTSRPEPRPATEPAEYDIAIGSKGAPDHDEPVEYDIVIRKKGQRR